jgi:hypothetical protein
MIFSSQISFIQSGIIKEDNNYMHKLQAEIETAVNIKLTLKLTH